MKKAPLYFSLVILMQCYIHQSTIAQSTREWTVVATYQIPGKASGLAWDGTWLYAGLYSAPGDDNLIYRIDPSDGSYTLQCAGPFESAYGLTYDGTYLWTTDHPGAYIPADAIQFDMSGNLVSTFELPATYISGIEWDNGHFWVCAYYDPDGMVYKLDEDGNILDQFPSPYAQPWDICKENDYLWIADYWGNMISKIDTDGNVIENHPSVGEDPAGITFDGQYLWYCDGPLQAQSTLYKIDLGGSGTPDINLPQDSHSYGIVTVGDSAIWNMEVQNVGAGSLTVSYILIPDAAPVYTFFTLPVTIEPGTYVEIPMVYKPPEPIPLNTQITVVSDDPVTPEVAVFLTGEAVYDGPVIEVSEENHNYGNVRMNAFTRWFLEITNPGNATLTISAIDIDEPGFILDEGTVLPLHIGVLQAARVGIWFNPTEAINYEAVMAITHNGINQNPYPVILSGTGLDQEWPIGSQLWYYNIDASYDNSPKAIAPISDITGDGVSDVIICSEDDYVRCFNGNSHNQADVIWETEIYSGAAYSQKALVIISDIDGDEYQDLVVGFAWGDRSITAFSGKTGEQIWRHDTHEYGDGGWIYQVDARFDYNNDGVKDILAATGDDGNDTGPRRIYCLDGLDGEPIWACFTGGPNFAVIGIEDIDGDDIPDVLAGASNGSETQGKVYVIRGSNGTIKWTYTTAGSSVWAVEQLKDINNDDVPDVAAGDFSGHIYYLSGTTGSVLESAYVGSSIISRFELIEDVNGDEHDDILVATIGANSILHLISGLDASDIWAHPLPDQPSNVAGSNDLTGDGISDVLAGTLYSDNYLFFLDGVTGSELESIHIGEAVDAINAIPDITGDGSFEMVGGGREGAVLCYSGGTNSLAGIPARPVTASPSFHSTAWPNPSSGAVNISFYLPAESLVTVDIYTASGKMTGRIFESSLQPGDHQVTWDGCDTRRNVCPAGVYLYRITAGKGHSSGMMVRL